jgi:hypothetical protein
VHSTSPVNSFTSGQSTAIPSRAHLSLQRVYSYPTLLTTFALSRWSTSDGGPIKLFFRAILRPFILAAFVLPSGDGTAYPLVVCRVLQTNDEFYFRDNYHPFHLQLNRHPLRTFTPLPVLFVVCATSTLPRLAHTIPPPIKVALHLTFINSPGHCRIALLVAIEYAWNTYPSTNRSSLVLFTSHLLLLIGVFFGYPTGISRRRVAFKKVLVETESERVTVTATEDDSGTDSAQGYGDGSDGMSTPTTLEFRELGERVENASTGETSSGETVLSPETKMTDSNVLNMMVLDNSSL